MDAIETPRLLLRRWREEDVAPFAAINSDPQVMRWIGDGTVRDLDQTRAQVAAIERGWEERGFGLFALELRESGELVGFTGLAVPRFLPEVLPAVEIGWRLGRPFWGRGLAGEAARATLRSAFLEHRLERVVGIARTENTASIRVMRRLGMRRERTTVLPGTHHSVVVYEITRDAYGAQG
ncbi:Protein N-acetyltransferase, RimJ/RimL family [Marinactinospora thermotolerans DSM 45154]|uniref:Protein N-acetyltransferase, RimJ/RimL family n=1 Tax=Marinactinospora thermotolerans DSM 45154 TaxID=1122192 RepID=A0A1T4JX54_9ACTN|nr:GNAT family N-acetyltransferase [Marinactinospora thermotolerans]SJZ34741.1 Protein N-acetyltransferase, RimJ/RimL family [Marinactinospora thermotolerans DSM 45154]